MKINKFTDLDAWKIAHELVLEIYKLTKTLPKEELYSLQDQMKRASISVSSNIAEGFSRKNNKEKIHFFYIAKGSLTELQNQLLVSKDVHYIGYEKFLALAALSVRVHKLINGLIKHLL